MNRFLTNKMRDESNYIVDSIEDSEDSEKSVIKEKLYYEIELFLRAKYKLEQSGLMGTNQKYQNKLDTILKTIIKTSTFIECPLEFKIPASYPTIIDSFINGLQNIFGWEKLNTNLYTKYVLDVVLDSKDFKLRKASDAYETFLNKIGELNDELDTDKNSSGVTVTPGNSFGYEIGYSLVPADNKLIEHRQCDDTDLEVYIEHPLFFTNGT